jgi:hypothetical protein
MKVNIIWDSKREQVQKQYNFGYYDKQGREFGCSVYYCRIDVEAHTEGQGYNQRADLPESGTYWRCFVQATRDGKKFGAIGTDKFFKESIKMHEYRRKRIAASRKRARDNKARVK